MNTETKLMRPELWAWLDQKNDPVLIAEQGKGTSIVVKVPKSKETDYLFGFDSYYGSISRRDSLYFCGLYERQRKSLYLADSPLEDLTEGLTEVERMDLQQLAEYIAKQVNQVVEGTIENDRDRLQIKELTSPDAVSALHTYQRYTAETDAIKKFFQSDPEPIQFHSDYQMWDMTEEKLLAYVHAPDTFIRDTAEAYTQKNQEKFLLQFLENDSMEKKYQAFLRNDKHPIHQMRDITEAVEACGGKTVSVTVQKDGKELTFRTSARSLKGYHDTYDLYGAPSADHRRFEEVFGICQKYRAEDIVRITYGRNSIYEAPQVQKMDRGMRMRGM